MYWKPNPQLWVKPKRTGLNVGRLQTEQFLQTLTGGQRWADLWLLLQAGRCGVLGSCCFHLLAWAGWGKPERQIHPGHCLQPPMGLSRMVVFWIDKPPSGTVFPRSLSLCTRGHHLLMRDFSQGHYSTKNHRTELFLFPRLLILFHPNHQSFLAFCSKSWAKDSELLPGWT